MNGRKQKLELINKKIMMRYKSLIAKVAIFSLVLGLVAVIGSVKAAALTTVSDTMTRQGAGMTSTHDIVFTLPAGIDFDYEASTVDTLTFNFSDTFTVGGTWAVTDFAFNDGTARTIAGIDTTWDGSVTCTDGANNVGVEINTASADFRVIPCSGSFVASPTGATVNFSIYGAAPDGTLTNPNDSTFSLAISMKDEGVVGAHSTTIQMATPDSDQVTINAEVESTMVFDLDVGVATGADTSVTPYTVDLGTLSSGSVSSSGDGTINMIGVDLSSNATGGTVVTVRNTNGAAGLVSASTPSDAIEVATGVFAGGSEQYNICVHRVFATTGNLRATAFDADTLSSTGGTPDLSTTCDADTHNVGSTALSTTPTSILDTNSLPVDTARAEIFVKASVSTTTPAHLDYTDTLTFIATGTF